MKRLIVGIAIVGLATGVLGVFARRHLLSQAVRSLDVPVAVEYQEFVEEAAVDVVADVVEPTETPEADPVILEEPAVLAPERFNLAVPFTSQAPHANWNLPYQEACEEASVLMAASFFDASVDLSSPNAADEVLLSLIAFEENLIGTALDTTAEETARTAEAYFPALRFELMEQPTVEEIQAALAAGSPIIVPAAGRALGNPFFSDEGPLYHMLVIRGYTSTGFITNDPGTRRGEAYVYPFDRVMQAMGDWNGGRPETGARVVIRVSTR